MELTKAQQLVLTLLGKSPLAERFYWTGGTLLAYHYLHHRHSVDLDFFTQEPFTFDEVNSFIQEVKQIAHCTDTQFRKIFDRQEFLLEKGEEQLRIEFVLYNGSRKTLNERVDRLFGVRIDSLDDLAANKTLAYFDRTEPKDLFDLYFLLVKKHYTVGTLLALVHKKFGVTLPESLFWSESFKHLSLLSSLHPLIENDRIISEITAYVQKQSDDFLKRTIEE